MSNPYPELSKVVKSLSLSAVLYADAMSKMTRAAGSLLGTKAALVKRIEIDRGLLDSANAMLAQVRHINNISPDITSLTGANMNLARMLESASTKGSVLSKIFQDQQGLLATIKGPAINDSWASAFARIDATRTFSASLLAQMKLSAFDRLSLGKFVGADCASSKALTINFGNLTRSYQCLLDAASTCESLFKHVPFIAVYSPIEYYREVKVLETLTVEPKKAMDDDDRVVIDGLAESIPSADALLTQLNNSLCKLLTGARDSLASGNPDRVRHVTASVRELFTQVLHVLAPDAEIRAWSTNAEHFHNNRPTRRARLLYICRHINSDPLLRGAISTEHVYAAA